MFYQEKPKSLIIPIWYDTTGVLIHGKTKFNGTLVVRKTSTKSLEVTVPNIGESFWIYMTVVFKDKSGTIIDGPIFSKCEIKHLSEYMINIVSFNQ